MNRRPPWTLALVLLLLLALGAAQGASLAAAEPETTTPSPPTPPPASPSAPAGDSSPILASPLPAAPSVGTPAPAQDFTPKARSGVSADLAKMLTSGMPHYDPPKPKVEESDDFPDGRETDKPKNAIPRLPKFVVHATPPPIFTHREALNMAGRVDWAMAHFHGLGIVPAFNDLNAPIAEQMFRDQERLDSMADLADTARSMAQGGDKAESAYILKASQETYMRSEAWTWNGPANNIK